MALIEVKDVFGFSGSAKKLVEVISVGVGKISEPYLVKRRADARAYEIREITKAILENQGILKAVNYDAGNVEIRSPENPDEIKALEASVAGRALLRDAHSKAIKQVNIEAISQIAYEQLKDEKVVSDEKVDDNWTHRFFDIAGEISNEELQLLWGRVLAGEIKQPKSYSLRTLEILRNISKQEADVFLKYAKIAVWVGNEAFVFNPAEEDFLTKNFGLTFTDRLLMEELGLLNSQPHLSIQLGAVTHGEKQNLSFICGDSCLAVERLKDCPAQSIPVLKFTKTGIDLLRLVTGEAPEAYFEKLASTMKSDKSSLTYGRILNREANGQFTYQQIKNF